MAVPALPDTVALTRFDLDGVSAAERFPVWKESISVVFDVELADPGVARGFDSRLVTGHLGSLLFSQCTSRQQLFRRDRRQIARDGLDHFFMQLFRRGENVGNYGGTEVNASAGDLFLVDLSQPMASRVTDFENLTLVIPRALLARHVVAPERLHGRTLSGRSALGGLLRDHVEALWNRLPVITPGESQAVAEGVLPLIAAYFSGGQPPAPSLQTASATREAIRHYIGRHLCEPTLSPVQLARRFGISRASLYRLFEPEGGPAGYIRTQRLRLSLSRLTDPGSRTLRIGDIARSAGFADEAHFSRLFRRTFGVTARDLRDSLVPDCGPDPALAARAIDRRYEQWLRTLVPAGEFGRTP